MCRKWPGRAGKAWDIKGFGGFLGGGGAAEKMHNACETKTSGRLVMASLFIFARRVGFVVNGV